MRPPEHTTWDALEKLWLADRIYAGPSEKYDYEQEWRAFRALHEQTAANIWDQGFDAGEFFEHNYGSDSEADYPDNPYRASENA